METIRASGEIDRLFREGRRVAHPLVTVLVAPREDGQTGRVAVVAGRKIGGAVRRNRAKRVLREACRRAGGPWQGVDVVLAARSQTGDATPQELDAAIAGALGRADVRK